MADLTKTENTLTAVADAAVRASGAAGTLASAFSGAFRAITQEGGSLKNFIADFDRTVRQSALKNLQQNLINTAVSGLSNLAGGSIPAFAQGGVINAPTFFPTSQGTALAGEAGSEAVLPLTRDGAGRLGVKSEGVGGVNITFNVSAADAGSFRRSEAQLTNMLLRAVRRQGV